MFDPMREFFLSFGDLGLVIWTLVKILAITLPVVVGVAFYTLAERKVIGWMHVRHGPQFIGGFLGIGFIQAFADVFKMLFKELVVPTNASGFLYRLAPLLALALALAAWAVIPFDDGVVLANVNAGLLVLLALTSMGVYGIIVGGWASNSKYAVLGALRSAAQVISYEIAMGFALVGVLVAAGTMNLSEIVMAQSGNAGAGEGTITISPDALFTIEQSGVSTFAGVITGANAVPPGHYHQNDEGDKQRRAEPHLFGHQIFDIHYHHNVLKKPAKSKAEKI